MRAPIPLLVLALLAAVVPAQEEEVGKPYWVSTPPGATAALKNVTTAIAGRDWNGAARSLQVVFDKYPGSFAKSGNAGSYIGARHRAAQLLATAPAAVRDEYERLYSASATEALQRALAANDRRALRDVVRRFEGTRAGLRAILALADRALLRGRPAEARLLLARLRVLHPETLATPALQRRVAVAAARDHAEGGPAPSAGEKAAGAYELPHLQAGAWPMLGGGPTRNRRAEAPGVAKLPALRYPPLDVTVPERKFDQPPRPNSNFGWNRPRRRRVDWERKWAQFNPIHPVVARGSLLVNDGRQIHAYNLYRGEERWRFPPRSDVGSQGRTSLGSLFTPVVKDGVVYGAIEVERPYKGQTLQGIPITYYIPRRRLVALDLETGDVLWRHDDAFFEAHPDSEPLRRISMTGPPVVRGDTLYLGACYSEGTFHNFVVAVDRHSGEMSYRTRISNGQQELNLFGRQLQEAVPTPVTEKDGVLYVGTNLGVFCAVDALLGTPLWATSYPILAVPSTYYWFEAPRRWPLVENNPPLVSGDTVVVAPADGTHVLGLDRRSGRPRWRTPSRLHFRDKLLALRHLIAVDEERAYFSGESGVVALWLVDDPARDAKAGEVHWEASFADETRGAGRGFLAPDGLWVPTLDAVYRIAPDTGRLLGFYSRQGESDEGFTHILWASGALVTAGRTFVSARFDPETVVARARAAIRARPDDVGPLLDAADVYLAIGGLAEAVDHFRRARALAAERGVAAAERRAAQGLHRALLLRARTSLDTGEGRAAGAFETAFRAAPDDRARLRARMQLHAWLGERDRSARADWRLRNLRTIEKEHGDALLDETTARTVRTWALREIATLHVEADALRKAVAVLHRLLEVDPEGEDARHAHRMLRVLLETHGRTIYAPYEARARQLFADALAAGDLEALERGLRIYAAATAAVDATLELARRRLAADEPEAAGRVLQRFLVEHNGSARVPDALVLLFRSLHARRSHGPAYAALLRLKSRHGDAYVPRADGARVTAREFATSWLGKEPYRALARSTKRRDLAASLAQRFTRTFTDGSFLDVPDLLGQRPEALPEVVVLRSGTRIYVLDAASGEEVFPLDFGSWEPKGALVFAGNRLHAVTDRRLHVFDAATGRAIARRPVPDRGHAIRLLEHRGQVFLVYRRRGQVGLAALHPGDGTVIWSRLLEHTGDRRGTVQTDVVARGERLLVFTGDPVGITVLDPTSGSVENRLPLAQARSNTQIAVAPYFLPDGRVLVGLTKRNQSGFEFLHSYSVALVDPGSPPESAVLWKYASKRDGENRYLLHLNVCGDYVACLDEVRTAVVLDLRTGKEVKAPTPLAVTTKAGELPYLDSVQPRHPALLLVLTRSVSETPARLSAYELPDLRRKYSLPLTDTPLETARLIEAEGALGVAIGPRRGRQAAPRVRVYDPVSAKLLEELTPPARNVSWINAKVQNGILLVTTNTNTVYAYGPR